jgi:hypothetical protein
MSPADLPWWGWLLCGAGTSTATLVYFSKGKDTGSGWSLMWALLFGIASALCWIVGIVRLVKWAWEG